MSEAGPVDICYVFSNGFGARMALESGVVPRLREHSLSLAIMAPNVEEPAMRQCAARYGIRLVSAPDVMGPRQARYHRMRRFLFEDFRRNPALWARYRRMRANPPGPLAARLQEVLYYPTNVAARWLPPVRRRLEQMEKRALANAAMADALRRLSPTIAVATFPIDPLESSFLFEAHRQGVHTVAHMMSWDNITSKGRFPLAPDSFISWGPIMTQEIEEFYGTPRERIHECGVAHFDAHARVADRAGTHCVFEELGIDPQKPYLFFGMSTPTAVPREIEVVERLAIAVQRGLFGPDLQLVIRQHPQNMDTHAPWLKRLEAIRGDRVRLDYPMLEESRLRWKLNEEDMPRLARLIRGCAVCLNSGSTLLIEALVQDKPTILTAFDVDDRSPWWESARRSTDIVHISKVVELGGIRVVRSFGELESAVRVYLTDPTLDAAARATTRQAECGPCDGHAAERVAEALASICSGVVGHLSPELALIPN